MERGKFFQAQRDVKMPMCYRRWTGEAFELDLVRAQSDDSLRQFVKGDGIPGNNIDCALGLMFEAEGQEAACILYVDVIAPFLPVAEQRDLAVPDGSAHETIGAITVMCVARS